MHENIFFVIEKAERTSPVEKELPLDRRRLLIGAVSAALSLRFASTLKADDGESKEGSESGMLLDSERTEFLSHHGILQEWYAIAKELEGLSIRDEESETIVSVPPTPLTPEMIATIREGYIAEGHLVCDDGSFVVRLNIAVPAVRGRVSFVRGHVDVQMLVSRERIVNVDINGSNTVAGTRIYQEQTEYVPFGISVIDATGKEVGKAGANRNNIATVDGRIIDYVQPFQIKFRPREAQEDLKKSSRSGISPYDDEVIA